MKPPKASIVSDTFNNLKNTQSVDDLLYDSQVGTINRKLFDAVAKHAKIDTDSHVLDLGSFVGASSLLFERMGAHVTCVDGSLLALEWCKKSGVGSHHVACDLNKGRLPRSLEELHDVAFSTETLKFLKDPSHALEQIFWSLKSGGIMGISIDLTTADNAVITSNFPNWALHNQPRRKNAPIRAFLRQKVLDHIKTQGATILSETALDEDHLILLPHDACKYMIVAQKLTPGI